MVAGIGVTLGFTTELNHLSGTTYLLVTLLAFVPFLAAATARRLRPRGYELWGEFHGLTVQLFPTDDERQYGQVTRALLRAQEAARLDRKLANPSGPPPVPWSRPTSPDERSGRE